MPTGGRLEPHVRGGVGKVRHYHRVVRLRLRDDDAVELEHLRVEQKVVADDLVVVPLDGVTHRALPLVVRERPPDVLVSELREPDAVVANEQARRLDIDREEVAALP